MVPTLGDGMAESGEGDLTEDLDFLHHLWIVFLTFEII